MFAVATAKRVRTLRIHFVISSSGELSESVCVSKKELQFVYNASFLEVALNREHAPNIHELIQRKSPRAALDGLRELSQRLASKEGGLFPR